MSKTSDFIIWADDLIVFARSYEDALSTHTPKRFMLQSRLSDLNTRWEKIPLHYKEAIQEARAIAKAEDQEASVAAIQQKYVNATDAYHACRA